MFTLLIIRLSEDFSDNEYLQHISFVNGSDEDKALEEAEMMSEEYGMEYKIDTITAGSPDEIARELTNYFFNLSAWVKIEK